MIPSEESCLTVERAVYAEQLAVEQKSAALSSPRFTSKELLLIVVTSASLPNLAEIWMSISEDFVGSRNGEFGSLLSLGNWAKYDTNQTVPCIKLQSFEDAILTLVKLFIYKSNYRRKVLNFL